MQRRAGMPQTDGERALADLKRLADFGRYQTGVHRPTYSKEDVASRHWLAEQFAAAGLDPVIDGIGNVIGRNPHGTRRLLVGSHSETQPRGGWLDGALGVIYALELARAFAADPALNGLGIEPIAWADEEGHFGNMLGSRSFTSALPESEIDAGRSRDGVPLRAALAEAVLAGRPREQLDPQRYVGYLQKFERELFDLVSDADRMGPCDIAIEPMSKSEPAAMDPEFQASIEQAAERHAPGAHRRMPSGAGHDAQILSRRIRSGMMFVPSLNGISHHWSEDTKEEDIVLGAQVFADAAAAILRAGR